MVRRFSKQFRHTLVLRDRHSEILRRSMFPEYTDYYEFSHITTLKRQCDFTLEKVLYDCLFIRAYPMEIVIKKYKRYEDEEEED